MRVIDIVILVGWLAFWIYWLVAAANVKAGSSRWGRFAGFRVAIVLIVLLLLRLKVLRGHAVTKDPWLWGVGVALFGLGLGLAVWARVYLGRNWGAPMSQKKDPDLVTTGPYRAVRHPIYSGIILGMIGTTVAISVYWLVAVVVLGAYFAWSATREERYMAQKFPDTYPGYKQSTRMLIPFIF